VSAVSPARLARSASLVGAATTTSRILGLVRDQLLAFLFGAGDQMDAYLVASRIPNLFRDLFAEGAMSSAFVPVFTRRLTLSGPDDAWQLGSQVLNTLMLVTAVLVLLGIAFAGPLVGLFASDYAAVPGKLQLTTSLARLVLPFLPLVAVAAVFMGMLNSLHRFFVPALSPAVSNVAVIACALLLVPVMPLVHLPRITAIALGILAGGVGQAALQWPALRREGFRYSFALDPRDPALREVLVLMGPGLLGLAASQINLLVNTVLAIGQGTGAVSWLSYAFRLMYMPVGIIGMSIATAAVPVISRQAAETDLAGMRETLSAGLRMMLACYAPALVGYSAVRLAVPAFYALHDSRTPVAVSMMTVLLNVVLNVILVRAIGYAGLALGTAFAALFNASLLLWLLRSRLGGIDGRRIASALAKILAASSLMGLVAWHADTTLASAWPSEALVARTLRVGTDICIALVALGLAARLLRVRELSDALALVRARIAGRA
jgi:putative peptidoglycan lipid II flippase